MPVAGRGVSAQNGSGRPEPAHRAPGAEWGAPVVAGEGTAETVASEPRVSEAPSVPFGLHRGDALATADTMLRDVVRQSVAAAGARKKEVGRALSLEKKALFDVLRRDMAVSVVRSDALVAAAVEALEAAAEADATCGFGNDGNLARAILSELEASAAGRGTPKNALALLQARLYDSRYDSGKSGAGGDRAGGARLGVHNRVLGAASSGDNAPLPGTPLRILDFGSGDGRFLDEFERAAASTRPLSVVAYDVSLGALQAFRRRCTDRGCFAMEPSDLGRVTNSKGLVVSFVVGDALASPSDTEELLRGAAPLGSNGEAYDVVLSGWGSTSAIPDLVKAGRQAAFLQTFQRLAPRLLQVVSSTNNFLEPQKKYDALRAARKVARDIGERCTLNGYLRLATNEGDFYYSVQDHEYFYSAVTPQLEQDRLLAAGYMTANVSACSVASFRDLLRSDSLLKLEAAALRLINANNHSGLQRLLMAGARVATKGSKELSQTVRLFDPEKTLVHQCARYLISVAERPANSSPISIAKPFD